MADTTFADAPPEGALDEQVAARNRKVLLAVGGIVGALVVLGGGYLLLSGGSSSPAALPPVRHITRQQPTVVGAAPTPAPLSIIPGTFTGTLGRDPFKPLYVAPVVVAVANVPTGGTSHSPTPVTSPVATGGGTGGSTTGAGQQPPPVAKTYPLKLVRVDRSSSGEQTAVFLVNGVTVNASLATATTPATIFGPNKELQLEGLTEEDAGRWTATLAVGESRTDAQQGVTIFVA